jgi:hypothetical protein
LYLLFTFTNSIRLPETHDWVVFVLLFCTILYLFLLNILQRDASIKSFVLQDFSETSNVFQSYAVIGIITTFLLSTLGANYLPVIPEPFNELQLLGYQLSNFGFCLLAIGSFYLIKSFLSFLFFQTLGAGNNWKLFCYTSSKFYFILSFLLVVLCYFQYFLELPFKGEFYMIDSRIALEVYLYLSLIALVFKNLYYLFNKNNVLPFSWYYKILYICTLQIAPVLALWKLIFI